MGSITNYLENELLDHITGEGAYAHVATTYAALVTVDPDDTADAAFMAANEVVVGAGTYARQAITWNPAAAGNRAISNNGALVFSAVGAAFGTIHGVCVMDSDVEGAGNVLGWCLVTEKAVADGETYTIATGDLDISIDASGAGGGIHSTFADELLNFAFDDTDMADRDGATAPWVALFTANGSDAAHGTEVVVGGSNYARKQDTFAGAAGGTSDNDTQLDWVCAGANYGTVSGIGLMKTTTEAATDLMFWFDSVEGDAVIDIGDTFQIVAGGLDVTLT